MRTAAQPPLPQIGIDKTRLQVSIIRHTAVRRSSAPSLCSASRNVRAMRIVATTANSGLHMAATPFGLQNLFNTRTRASVHRLCSEKAVMSPFNSSFHVSIRFVVEWHSSPITQLLRSLQPSYSLQVSAQSRCAAAPSACRRWQNPRSRRAWAVTWSVLSGYGCVRWQLNCHRHHCRR